MSYKDIIFKFKQMLSASTQNQFVLDSLDLYKDICIYIKNNYTSEDLNFLKELLDELSSINNEFYSLTFQCSQSNIDNINKIDNILDLLSRSFLRLFEYRFKKIDNGQELISLSVELYKDLFSKFITFFNDKLPSLISYLKNFSVSIADLSIDKHLRNIFNYKINSNLINNKFFDSLTYQTYILNSINKTSDEYDLYFILPLLSYLEKYLLPDDVNFISKISSYLSFYPFIDEGDKDEKSAIIIIKTLVEFAEKSRKEGLLSLEDNLEELTNMPFLVKGLQLVIDGTDPELINSIMKNKIKTELDYIAIKNTLIIEGVLGIQFGYNPRIVEEKLYSVVIKSGNKEEELINKILNLCEKSRREGLLALSDDLDKAKLPLLSIGLKLIIEGSHPLVVKSILDIISQVIRLYYNNIYQITLTGILNIQMGTDYKIIKTLLENMLCFFSVDKQDLKNIYINTGLQNILKSNKIILQNNEKKEEYNIVLMDFLLFINSIIKPAGQLEVLSSFIFSQDKIYPLENEILNGLINIFNRNETDRNILFENQSSLLIKLNEYIDNVNKSLDKINENDMKVKRDAVNITNNNRSLRLDTIDKIKKIDAKKKPSLKNLSYFAKQENIVSYIKQIGELYDEQKKKYEKIIKNYSNENIKKFQEITTRHFDFVPEINENENPDFIMGKIIDVFFDNENLFSLIDTFSETSSFINIFLEKVIPFNDLTKCSFNSIKNILHKIDQQTLVYSLKGAPDSIRDLFLNQLPDEVKNKIIEELDSADFIDPIEAEEARKKIRITALKEKEIIIDLKFYYSMKKQIPDFNLF